MPREAIPDKWEFLLTTDRDQVQESIAEARRLAKQGENAWPRYQLLWELHPVMQWLIDRGTCRFQRHEAPVMVAPGLEAGQMAYLFQGMLSNRQSQPVIVEWFAVARNPEGEMGVQAFGELMRRTGFAEGIPNTGEEPGLRNTAQEWLAMAVGVARKHMEELRVQRSQHLQERVDEDKARFKSWHGQSLWQIEQGAVCRRP